MLVLLLAVMMRGPRGEIVLGGGIEAEDELRSIAPSVTASIGTRARRLGGDRLLRGFKARLAGKIGLGQQHDIGAADLVLEHFRQRRLVVELSSAARCASTASGSARKRPAATASASASAITPSTVMRERISGQSKAFNSGLGSARPEVSIRM